MNKYMENCSQYDDLLTRYLLDELESTERECVSEWINSSEENSKYFEVFKGVWNLTSVSRSFETINIDDEWKHAQKLMGRGEVSPKLFETSPEFASVERPRRGNVYRILVSTAIAASVVAVVGMLVLFLSQDNVKAPSNAVVKLVTGEKKLAVPVLETESNTSGESKSLLLSDGSVIVLYANSEVSYDKTFTGNTRDLRLKGKADFKVFKDKTKPFIVHSADISTTVLGTVFTVTSFEKAKSIRVKLYEGKVMVKSENVSGKRLKSDFYLLPGQELVYDNLHATAVVKTFKPAGGDRKDINKGSDDLSLPDNFKGSWFMFNNQTLPEVFDQLQSIFNSEIVYSKADLSKMYFIGRFDKTDSLETILKNMANLYHLKVTKENKKYVVTK